MRWFGTLFPLWSCDLFLLHLENWLQWNNSLKENLEHVIQNSSITAKKSLFTKAKFGKRPESTRRSKGWHLILEELSSEDCIWDVLIRCWRSTELCWWGILSWDCRFLAQEDRNIWQELEVILVWLQKIMSEILLYWSILRK